MTVRVTADCLMPLFVLFVLLLLLAGLGVRMELLSIRWCKIALLALL